MNVKAILLALLLPLSAQAQGFAGMASDAEGFAIPEPNPVFNFPEDHGPHPDFRIEWWYITANLTGPDGTPYGLQWTLFRSAMAPETTPGWSDPQLWMGHAAVTTTDAHYVTERLARGGIGQAGVAAEPFSAWIDDWQMTARDPEVSAGIDDVRLTASGPDFAYDMQLTAQGPLVFQGEGGFSVKSTAGQASYYYSQPFYDIAGTFQLPQGNVEVTGHAWLDREWSSQPLIENQTGWDWFSLSFNDGAKMMGYRLRNSDNTSYNVSTWINPDQSVINHPDGVFNAEQIATTDIFGREVPTSWRVTLPDQDVDITVAAINPLAWMDTSVPYWEGPVTVTGSHQGTGYLEMTGYD